jgi:hypothetical protein
LLSSLCRAGPRNPKQVGASHDDSTSSGEGGAPKLMSPEDDLKEKGLVGEQKYSTPRNHIELQNSPSPAPRMDADGIRPQDAAALTTLDAAEKLDGPESDKLAAPTNAGLSVSPEESNEDITLPTPLNADQAMGTGSMSMPGRPPIHPPGAGSPNTASRRHTSGVVNVAGKMGPNTPSQGAKTNHGRETPTAKEISINGVQAGGLTSGSITPPPQKKTLPTVASASAPGSRRTTPMGTPRIHPLQTPGSSTPPLTGREAAAAGTSGHGSRGGSNGGSRDEVDNKLPELDLNARRPPNTRRASTGVTPAYSRAPSVGQPGYPRAGGLAPPPTMPSAVFGNGTIAPMGMAVAANLPAQAQAPQRKDLARAMFWRGMFLISVYYCCWFMVSLNAAISLSGYKFTSLWPEMVAAWLIKLSPIIDALVIYELMRRSESNKQSTVLNRGQTQVGTRHHRFEPQQAFIGNAPPQAARRATLNASEMAELKQKRRSHGGSADLGASKLPASPAHFKVVDVAPKEIVVAAAPSEPAADEQA